MKNTFKFTKIALFTLPLTMMLSLSSHAYLTTGESAELTPQDRYKIGVEPQIRVTSGSGVNISGFIDRAINDSSSFRIHLGAGDTDFYTGGSYKWIPIPDFDQQPAIGGKVSLIYGRESGDSLFVVRAEPLISKKFDTEYGHFTPYGAIPVNFINYKSRTETGIQISGGTEYHHDDIPDWGFGGEVGINAKDTFGYISVFATFVLDNEGRRAPIAEPESALPPVSPRKSSNQDFKIKLKKVHK